MASKGVLVAGAVLLAAVAAGLFYWTQIEQQLSASSVGVPAAPSAATQPSASPSSEDKLVSSMMEAAKDGGFAITFSQKDGGKWKVAGGHRLERFNSGASGPVFARLTSSVPLAWTSNEWPAQGLSVLLPREFAELANGRTIEIGIIARTTSTNGSPYMAAIYATQQAGNSQWKTIKLTPQFEMHKFTYDVPRIEEGYTAEPIVVLHSDMPGTGRAVEVIGLYVKAT